ncbi:MAG: LacI family DNA-binding transcriptional regulator [Proteobacteria bacterium]|nr:LacI family DNA-binding transcriptional regulator [Pseudomonadota bacterium]
MTQSRRHRAQRLTLQDLARIAGVSTMTVSRALRNSKLVNEDTRAKIQALARKQGYSPNLSARSLRLGRTDLVGVIVEMEPTPSRPMSGPYPLEILGGICQEMTSRGFGLLFTTLQHWTAHGTHHADGVILLGQGAHDTAAQTLGASGMPFVVWGAQRAGTSYVVVGSDNRRSGVLAAERLLSLGRRRLVFLGDTSHPELAERHAGFAETVKAAGATVVASIPAAFTFAAGVHAIQTLLRQPGMKFDGVFACSDLIAMGVVRALVDHRLQVPGDVSVIGHDDSAAGAGFVPALTTVHQNWSDGGVLLARKMLDLIEGRRTRSEQLPTTLVVRDT